jgi:citrate synthase
VWVVSSNPDNFKSYSKGLEGVIADETNISLVDSENGKLYYRGFSIEEIVDKKTFEECAHMILFGDFPDEQQLLDFRQELSSSYALPNYVNDLICALPANTHPMEVIQSVLAITGKYRPSQIKVRRVSDANEKKRAVVIGLAEQAKELIRILAQIPTIVANFYRAQQDLELLKPRPHLSLLGNFLYLFSGKEPSAQDTRVFEICQMLQMEHGLNSSTFTARVVASTLAPVHACMSAAVGALFGLLHGGADEAAFRMARDLIGHPDLAEQFVTKTLNEGGKIMGLGHRVYKTVDPRAIILRGLSAELNAGKGNEKDRLFKTLERVDEVATRIFSEQGKEIYANLEFYKGSVFNALDIPSSYFTSMFVISRSFGWAAHILELWKDHRLYRPDAVFTGQLLRPVIDKTKLY